MACHLFEAGRQPLSAHHRATARLMEAGAMALFVILLFVCGFSSIPAF